MPSPLLTRTLRGLGTSGALTALKVLIDVGTISALLWALGSPDPLGIMAVVMAAMELLLRLSSAGGSRYLIQRPGLIPRDISTVMATELSLAGLLTLGWLLGSGPALTALNRADLAAAALLMAPWVITEKLSQLGRALHEREMNFGRSNGSLLAGSIAMAAVAIPLVVWADMGAMALFAGKLAQSAVTCVSMWALLPHRPLPRWHRGHAAPHLRFGLPLFFVDLFQYIQWNGPILLMGVLLGPAERDRLTGLLYTAMKLPNYLLQIQEIVTAAVYPAFTRAVDSEQLRRGLHLVTKYSCAVALLPLALVLSLGPAVPLHLLGGEAFVGLTAPLAIFTALAAYRMTTVHWYAVCLAKGRTAPIPVFSLMMAAGSVTGVLLTLEHGLSAIALGIAVPLASVIALAIWVLLRPIVRFSYARATALPLLTGGVALLAGLGLPRLGWGVESPLGFWGACALISLVYIGLGAALDRRSLRKLAGDFFG